MTRLPFRPFALVASVVALVFATWVYWPGDQADGRPSPSNASLNQAAQSARTDGNADPSGEVRASSADLSKDISAPGGPMLKRESRFEHQIRTRFQWSETEKRQDWGQLLASWLMSGDSTQAMKALMLVQTCAEAKAYSDGLYAANHARTSGDVRGQLERNQARQRRCQSVVPLSSEQFMDLIDRGLRGGEPSAASYAIIAYADRKLPIPPTHAELVRAGLERDFLAGNLHSLQTLVFSAAQLGVSPVEAFSYEIAWRIITKQEIGRPLSADELDQALADIQSASEKPSREWLLKEFPDLLMRSGRPTLSEEELAAAHKRAGKLLAGLRPSANPPN